MSKRNIVLVSVGAVLVIAAVVGAVLVLTSDGGDTVEAVQPTTTTTESTTTTTLPAGPLAPLTGLPVADPSVLGRPALVVKVDNAEGLARPQAGVNQADVVYEEKVEGSVSRFATIFHSTDADPVGPVRSGRTTDIAIVGPLHQPLFAYSGANEIHEEALQQAPLVNVGVNVARDQYERVSGRRAPDNLFTTTAGLWGYTPEGAQPPTPLFTYRGEDDDLLAGEDLASVDYSFGGGAGSAPVRYVWDPSEEGWLRFQADTPHVDEAGVQIAPENVIVMFVEYVDTGQVDAAGNPVPEAQLVGEGEAWVLTAGRRVVGRWSRGVATDPTAYVDADGTPVALTPGRTWIALVPVGGQVGATLCADAPDDPACAR